MKLKNLILAMAMGCSLMAFAVPARRDLRTVTQPDGTTLTIKTIGDEHFHVTMTADGVPLVKDGGSYYFATLQTDGNLRSTGVIAADLSMRNEAQRNAAVVVSNDLLQKASAARLAARTKMRVSRASSLPQSGMGTFSTSFPSTGNVKVLVILVEYSDVKFKLSKPHEYFDNMLNKPGFSDYDATGSAYDYFRDQSNGRFHPQFDVLGPVSLPNKRSYYGANDKYGDDKHPEEMVIDAVKLLDPTVDFSVYDNDNDGVIDNVYVFYAGLGEASSYVEETVWPHSWSLSEANSPILMADGKKVDGYACSNEWESLDGQEYPTGIGTIAHEFSHVLGLPDLYSTNYDESATGLTPGEWSLMDYGSYSNNGRTPPCYSSFERNALKWIDPVLIDGPMNCTLEPLLESNQAYIVQTSKQNEFFLFENRQQNGWDEYTPGHGMLIWHIDFKQSVFDENTVNDNGNHMYVRIVKANNKESNQYIDGWPWPGTANKTSFTSSTRPAFKDWSNNSIDLPITDIAENDGIISFAAAGGNPLETPANLQATEFTETGFTLLWDPVEDADDYEIDITYGTGSEPTSTTANMGSGSSLSLPTDWTSNSGETYSTNTNFGESAPSLKLAATGKYLMTETFDSDITAISFWLKGNGTSGDSNLEVQWSDGSEQWTTFETIVPKNNKSETITLSTIPAGARQLRFYYNKDKGNIALDDVTVECDGGGIFYLEGFKEKRTGGENRLEVTPLAADQTLYKVKLRAIKENRYSAPCYLEVNTLETEICMTEASARVSVSVNGSIVTVVTDSPVRIYDISGRTVGIAPEGKSVFALPAGFYIIANRKFIIR